MKIAKKPCSLLENQPMSLTNNDFVKRAEEELFILKGVIDYAERMIYTEGNRIEYGPLRRHAYGKTVVIETESNGVLIFRLSSTSAVYPKQDSGYATPHSPVGRLCAYLRTGDEGESLRWGEYRVLEIRLLDRFDGIEFESNVRNFQRMTVETQAARGAVENLRRLADDANKLQQSKPISEIVIDEITVIDDDEPTHDEWDDDENILPEVAITTETYYGLSESFYINRTEEQDTVVSRSPVGAMFVQGVAGSGKTSAALGRTKMLCDFNMKNVVTEAEFREVAGDQLDYWAEQFAGQFSQEGSVGFVRTGELIQYLKETCRRLDLSHLPVQEYSELRSRLRQHRKLEQSKRHKGTWGGLPEPRGSHTDTTINWLKSADKAIALYWAQLLRTAIPTVDAVTSKFDDEEKPKANRIATIALDRLKNEVALLAHELETPHLGTEFLLSRLAVRVQACIQHVKKTVLDRNIIWAAIGAQSWIASDETEIAKQLISANVALYSKNGYRLVFLREYQLIDASLTLLDTTGQLLSWSDQIIELMKNGQVLVRNTDGKTVRAKAFSERELYLGLLPEATERLYIFQNGVLRPLPIQRGLGKVKMKINLSSAPSNKDIDNEESEIFQEITSSDIQARRSVDVEFTRVVRKALLQPLTYLTDAYAETLQRKPSGYPDTKTVRKIQQQFKEKKLADEDIDLLLCLAHLIGKDFKESPSQLSETDFYQSVFIDEVQDFTEQQVFLMAEQAQPKYRAVTVVGDTAQKLHNGYKIDIPACFPTQSIPIVELKENLRQLHSPGLAWFSACFRALLHEGINRSEPSSGLLGYLEKHTTQLHGPELRMVENEDKLIEHIINILTVTKPRQTVAVVFPNLDSAKHLYDKCKPHLATHMVDAELSHTIDLSRRHIRHFSSVANTKGLEFDIVIVPYLERYQLDDKISINHLYVAVTRAKRQLILISDLNRISSIFDDVWTQYQDVLATF